MSQLAAIFRFEWYRLTRNRLMLGSLVLFVLIAGLSIRTGRHAVQTRLVQLDSIRTAYQRDFQAQWQLVSDTSAAGRKKAAVTGLAAVVNFRLPQNALWTPRSLQTLSTGISDIQPFYHQVQTTVSYLEPPNIPVSNPVRLFAGNFDLAFVWLYILPLLIIAFCYPLYAEEKETGTAALLTVQGSSLRRIISYKWLFRTALISVLVLLINIAGILAAPGHTDTLSAWGWCWVTQLYVLLWATLAWMGVALRYNSSLTALLLTGSWLMAVMVAPAVANIYLSARHPLPVRSELASQQRHESEEIWSMNGRALADSFNAAHPQYSDSYKPARDTVRPGTRFVAAYYYLLDKRMSRAAAQLDSQVTARNRYFERMATVNPVLHSQQLYNRLAGASLADYKDYRQQVAVFQQQWKTFIYSFQLAEKPLGPEAFRQFPVFNLHRQPRRAAAWLSDCVLLYALILLTAAASYFLFNRNTQP
jgi:ABC-2 type transport system permease protein